MITGFLPYISMGVQSTCELTYHEERPYEISFVFRQRCPEGDCSDLHDMVWVIGRDLLSEGIPSDTWIGTGDVRIRRDSHTRVAIYLNSPHGITELQVPYGSLKNFLQRTYAVVDTGTESEHFDWNEFDQVRVTW